MSKALFLDYAEFEVHLASTFLKSKGFEIETLSVDDERKPIKGTSGFHSYPDRLLSSIDRPEDYGVFITPGGNVFSDLKNETLLNLVRRIRENGGLIGGICAGTLFVRETSKKISIVISILTPTTVLSATIACPMINVRVH
jgi:putative intracellular protease/amidase